MPQPSEGAQSHSDHNVTNPSEADSHMPANGDVTLSQTILERYSRSPGIIQMEFALGLAERISKFGTMQLSLVLDIYRRFAPANGDFLTGWSPINFVWLPGSTDTLFAPAHVTRSTSAEMLSHTIGRASIASPGGDQPSIRGRASDLPIVRPATLDRLDRSIAGNVRPKADRPSDSQSGGGPRSASPSGKERSQAAPGLASSDMRGGESL